MIKRTAIIFVVVAAPLVAADQPDLRIELEAPDSVVAGEPFEIRIIATNAGEDPLVFKRHWKWATNSWFLQVKNPDGHLAESTPFIGDISVDVMCSYFVPLYPNDSLVTTAAINGEWPPALSFGKPAEYRVRLVYVSEHRPREQHCSSGGVPIWIGRTESKWTQIKVVAK